MLRRLLGQLTAKVPLDSRNPPCGKSKSSESSRLSLAIDYDATQFITEDVIEDVRVTIRKFEEFKDIGEEHFLQIHKEIIMSMSNGMNLSKIVSEILSLNIPIMTKKRAGEIARVIANSTNALITRNRQMSVGLTHAIWVYSGAPCCMNPKRPSEHDRRQDAAHKAADGIQYEVEHGLIVNGCPTWPGREAGCRCASKSVMPGLT